MSVDRDIRLVNAMERVAASLEEWCKLYAVRLEKEHPTKREPSDATISHIPTPDELLKQEQTGDDANEPIDRWGTIGPREREFDERELAKSPTRDSSIPPKKPSS